MGQGRAFPLAATGTGGGLDDVDDRTLKVGGGSSPVQMTGTKLEQQSVVQV